MKKYLSILRNSPFFKGLSDSEILSILHCVNAVTISRKRDSYTGKSGRHRITRQPEERIRPDRTAEIPKTDFICKGENERCQEKRDCLRCYCPYAW